MHHDLRAEQSLGIHWGTFELSDEPLDEPPRALSSASTTFSRTAPCPAPARRRGTYKNTACVLVPLSRARAKAGVRENDFFLLALGQTRQQPRPGAAQ